MALVKIFAERAQTGFDQRLFQLAGACIDFAAFLVVAFVGLAARLEPAPLVEVEQRAAERERLQPFIEPLGAQFIGVERLQLLAFVGIGRHQAVPHQQRHQPRAALQVAVASPAHLPGDAAVRGERCPGFRGAAVREQPHADVEDAVRVAIPVERQRAPAERIDAEIDSQPICLHAVLPFRASGRKFFRFGQLQPLRSRDLDSLT